MKNTIQPQHSCPVRALTTRRTFFHVGAVACAALAASTKGLRAAPGAEKTAPRCLDYGLSFVRNTAAYNSVRMWIESRTTIVDSKTGKSTVYYQCGSCKAEDTFAKSKLFHDDNYDFLPIFGDAGETLIFRRKAYASSRYGYRQVAKDVWGKPVFVLREPGAVTELDISTGKKIWDAVQADLPLVGQTEFRNTETGLSALIEYPVKTMNVRQKDMAWQIDTGPIAFPDLGKRYERQIDCLSLAYIAVNAPGFADFLVESVTPILAEGKEVAKVHHYSRQMSLPSKNRVFALGKL